MQIQDLLGNETALCNTLWALKDAAHKTFFEIMKSRGEKLLRYPPLVAVDLSPPPPVREGVAVLLELIETYNSMMLPASGKKPAFDTVISAMLDPIVQVCSLTQVMNKFFNDDCKWPVRKDGDNNLEKFTYEKRKMATIYLVVLMAS